MFEHNGGVAAPGVLGHNRGRCLHVFRRRDGRANCELCQDTLWQFLLVCEDCNMRICVRCRDDTYPRERWDDF